MPFVRQTSFSAGEFSPLLWGRTDLVKFAQGLRHCRNFFISAHGAAVSRPGTVRVAEGKVSEGVIRLIPFIFSDEQSYCLEFGGGGVDPGYIRFHSDGATITVEALAYDNRSGGSFSAGNVVTGWASAASGTVVQDVPAGAAGLLWLRDVTGTFGQGETFSNTSGVQADTTGTQATVPYEVEHPYSPGNLMALQWAQSGDVLTLTHPDYPPQELSRLGHVNWTLEEIDFTRPAAFETSGGIPIWLQSPLPIDLDPYAAKEWSWAVTAVIRHVVYDWISESAPTTIAQMASNFAGTGYTNLPDRIAVYPDKPVTVMIPLDAYAAIGGYVIIGYRIYRGRGGVFGWVGDVGQGGVAPGAGNITFTDTGEGPNFAMAPPQGKKPFAVPAVVNGVLVKDYPAAVCYFEDRRIFGGTGLRPFTLFASATGDYANFDDRMIQVADEALTYGFAARKREDIRSMVGLDQLLVFTGASAWAFSTGGEASSPDAVPRARAVVEIGSRRLPPLVVGGSVLFARNKGGGVRSMIPGGQDGWRSTDVSAVAQHLFTGTDYDIVDWCYAEDPWGLIWAVRADGKLLSLTYSSEEQMWAWAFHETDGLVRNICAVPEGAEDAVYLVVERDNPDAGTSMASPAPDVIVTIERMTSRVRYGTIDDDVCLDCALKYDGALTQTLSGLAHLDGKDVYVVGKNNPVRGPFTVAGGAIELLDMPTANNGEGVVLWAGLLYQAEIETLDVAGADVRTRQKTLKAVGFEVDQSRGLWAGPDFDHLTEWRQRRVADSYASIGAATELVRMPTSGTWAEHGRMALRQTLPLPVTVVGVTREIELGG